MINLTLHNFTPDKFYTDHWVSPLGVVCSRKEAERIVEIEQGSQAARELRDKPPMRRKERFEEMRSAL